MSQPNKIFTKLLDQISIQADVPGHAIIFRNNIISQVGMNELNSTFPITVDIPSLESRLQAKNNQRNQLNLKQLFFKLIQVDSDAGNRECATNLVFSSFLRDHNLYVSVSRSSF